MGSKVTRLFFFFEGMEPFKRIWEPFTQGLETAFIPFIPTTKHPTVADIVSYWIPIVSFRFWPRSSLQCSNSGDHTAYGCLTISVIATVYVYFPQGRGGDSCPCEVGEGEQGAALPAPGDPGWPRVREGCSTEGWKATTTAQWGEST